MVYWENMVYNWHQMLIKKLTHVYPKVVHKPKTDTMYHYRTFESYTCMTLVLNVGICSILVLGIWILAIDWALRWEFSKSQFHEGQGHILAHVTSVRLLLDLFMVRWRKASLQLVLNANPERTKGLNTRSNCTISMSFTKFFFKKKKNIILTLGLWNWFCTQGMHFMFPYVIVGYTKWIFLDISHTLYT